MRMTEQQSMRRIEQKPFKKLRFVALDVDGTIAKETFTPTFGRKMHEWFGLPVNQSTKFAQQTMGTSTATQLTRIPDAFSLSSHHVLRFIDPSLREAISHLIEQEAFKQPIELFPDVLPALQRLKNQGVHIFISSSRPTESLWKMLAEIPDLAASSIGVRTLGKRGITEDEKLLSTGALDVINDFSSLPSLFDSERINPSEKLYDPPTLKATDGQGRR